MFELDENGNRIEEVYEIEDILDVLDDYREELDCEGERHFLRNRIEDGLSDAQALQILTIVEESERAK